MEVTGLNLVQKKKKSFINYYISLHDSPHPLPPDPNGLRKGFNHKMFNFYQTVHIFEFRALCKICILCCNFQELLEIMGSFAEIWCSVGPATNTVSSGLERVDAYGGSKRIQCETTEYLIPKVRTSWLVRF